MNRKKKLILFSIILTSLIPKVYASCTQEELDEFKKVEDEYKVTYEIDRTTKNYILTFHTTYIDRFDFRVDFPENFSCKEKSETETECLYAPPGEHKMEIIGMTEACNDILKTITLKLPKYNNYADDPLCEGIEEFYLCKPTYEKEISREDFESRVNTYKKNHTKEEIPDESPKIENEIIKYIKDRLIQIIIVVVFIILITITAIITIKSARKSRVLE